MDRSTLRRRAARIGLLRSLSRRARTLEPVAWDAEETFKDVVVVPFADLLDRWQGREAHCGGPSWPDWDRQATARHGQRGRPIDTQPAEPEDVPVSLDRAIWGGPLVRHYGHQIADFSTRLLAATRAHPDLEVLFATKPGFGWRTIADAPPFERSILDWFGIDPARCRIVQEPVRVQNLVVTPQAEQVGGPGPSDAYLGALLENAERQLGGLPQGTDATVYVSRAGMSSRFAGEAYLEEVLAQADVQVLRPETVPVVDQLRTYHGASRLIFAEGSALHTLQLTGRLEADVTVLERRVDRRLAEDNLEPRVASLTYEGCLAEQIHGTLPTGAPARAQGISVLDEEALLATFDRLGVRAADHWDRQRFERARDTDVDAWLAGNKTSSRGHAVRSAVDRDSTPTAPATQTSAPRPSEACLAALAREPLPLYSDGLDIALLWNAKAACTFAIKWFFFQDGVLDEAEVYAPWPHQYRQQVYCARPGYKDGVVKIPRLGPRAIKVVRDPFDRVVSSYLSYCTQADRPMETSLSGTVAASARRLREGMLIGGPASSSQHVPMLKNIGKHLGRTVGDGNLFTFREWVGFLESLDLDEADIHVRRQLHACEREGSLPDLTIVRAEEADAELPRLEETLGLRHSDHTRLRRSRHHTERVDDASFVADERFGGALGISIPTNRWFYDRELVDTVGRLYREDIDTYGYAAPKPIA